jgi:hypothetical protein
MKSRMNELAIKMSLMKEWSMYRRSCIDKVCTLRDQTSRSKNLLDNVNILTTTSAPEPRKFIYINDPTTRSNIIPLRFDALFRRKLLPSSTPRALVGLPTTSLLGCEGV